MCQDPIENMEIELLPSITTPQNPLWSPEIWMQTNENLEIKIVTTKGLPISYNVSFDDVFVDGSVTNEG